MPMEDLALCSHFFICLLAKPKNITLKWVIELPPCIGKCKTLLLRAQTLQFNILWITGKALKAKSLTEFSQKSYTSPQLAYNFITQNQILPIELRQDSKATWPKFKDRLDIKLRWVCHLTYFNQSAPCQMLSLVIYLHKYVANEAVGVLQADTDVSQASTTR